MEEFGASNWKAYVEARKPRVSKDEEGEKLRIHEEKYKAIKREVNKRFRSKRAIKEAVLERQYCDSATRSDDDSDENLEEFVSKPKSIVSIPEQINTQPQSKPVFLRGGIGF
jgi:predicted ribosome quality control (RQC) complex YloA/Tae2 family protein